MAAPVKAAIAPTPGAKEGSEGDAITKTDCTTHDETRPGGEEHDPRVVSRNHHEIRSCRLDRNVRTTANDDLSVRSQVAEIPGFAPVSLHRVHHVLLLGQERISHLACPVQ